MPALIYLDDKGFERQAADVNQVAGAYRSGQIKNATFVRNDRGDWIRASQHELFCRVRQIIDEEGLNYVPKIKAAYSPSRESPEIVPYRNSSSHRLRIRVLLRSSVSRS